MLRGCHLLLTKAKLGEGTAFMRLEVCGFMFSFTLNYDASCLLTLISCSFKSVHNIYTMVQKTDGRNLHKKW